MTMILKIFVNPNSIQKKYLFIILIKCLKLLHLYQLELYKVWQEMIGTQVGNCDFSLLFKMERPFEYCQKGLAKQNLNTKIRKTKDIRRD